MSGEENAGNATAAPAPARFFSLRSFLRGLVVVVLFYGILGGWLWLRADSTRQEQLSRLASQTVLIQRAASLQIEAPPPLPSETASVTGPETEPPETATKKALEAELYEASPDGPVPVRTADGRTVFEAFRRPFDKESQAASKPVISLALVGLGLSDSAGEAALRSMPAEISFSLSPYAAAPAFWIEQSRARGHEVWLDLPLEPATYPDHDPGPHTLLISAPERQNQSKLNWLMGRGTGIVGFVGSADPVFMDSANDMRPVIGTIFNRGMGFIDTAANPSSAARSMALGMNAAYASADVWLDNPPTKESIAAALEKLEKTAQEKGSAIGLFRPYPVSYQEVQRWLETLPQKNIALAPLSAQTD